ncbi:MAG: YdcF family protein [Candidatus Acidoferrales bacterium]|nr:YdcF family protein [Candidatus Acidoferrales bacterium]
MARRHSLRIIVLATALVVCVAGTLAFRGTGRWLLREDPLASADEIVVLSGSMPARAEEAARIFRMGYAHEVWVSRPAGPGEELEAMGIHYLGEEDFNREVLIHEGVPDADVRIFPQPIVNTEEEIEEICGQMRRDGKTSAMIVTSPQHTRRVRALWRKIAGNNLRLIVRGAPQDPFDANHWWRTTHDTFAVVREILGLLNVWVGLPVRPQSS